MKLNPYLTPHTKINSKWVRLNYKTLRKWQKLHIGFGNDFLAMTRKIQTTKEKRDKLDFMKI